jgi:hypothetical protein
MPTDRQLDQTISRWLEAEAPAQLPDRVLRATFERTRKTNQQGHWQAVLRRLQVNRMVFAIAGAAAVIVVAVVALGLYFNNPGVGAAPSPSAAPSPTAALTATPEPTSEPTQSPAAAPPLTQNFTSTQHGISVSYPEGWTARAATEPWTDRPGVPQFIHPGFDVLQDPVLTDHLFLHITSQPIGDSTPEDWVAASLAAWGCRTTEPIAVDGATGLIGADNCHIVAVTTAGRGYWIGLYTPDSGEGEAPPADFSYDRAWFEEVLATVQLRPAPPLSQSFTSAMHGISVSYPEGWLAQAATEPWTESTFPLEAGQPHADWLSDPIQGFNLFMAIASQPIGDSSPEAWLAAQMASGEGCSTTEPITVDGATGLIGSEGCDVVVVTTAGRGYWIQLYTSGDDPQAVAPYDRSWFEEFLATVELHPEDAVDEP